MRQKLSVLIKPVLALAFCVLLLSPAVQASKKKDLLKQAQAAEKAGDAEGAQSAYCQLSQVDQKNDAARAKCAEYTQRADQHNEDIRKQDAARIAAGVAAIAQGHFDEAKQQFRSVEGKDSRDEASRYLTVIIPQAELKFKTDQEKAAAEAKNNEIYQQGLAAYKRNEFDKAKPLLASVAGDNANNAQKLLVQMDDYTKSVDKGDSLEHAANYQTALESYNRALKIKRDGPGNLKEKIAAVNVKLSQLKQANEQPLLDGITAFYDGNFQLAEEMFSAFPGSGSKRALALFYLGASELSRYYLAGADDKSKDLYNQAIEHFRQARLAANGFSPPQHYVSQRILGVFNQTERKLVLDREVCDAL
jgi:hypothetical protein